MSSALRVPAKPPPEEGSPGERLICDCGHRFVREELDLRLVIEEFVFPGGEDELRSVTAWDVLEGHAQQRDECPQCSCCVEQDGEIDPDTEEGEEEWLCTLCGKVYGNEEDALDCCG